MPKASMAAWFSRFSSALLLFSIAGCSRISGSAGKNPTATDAITVKVTSDSPQATPYRPGQAVVVTVEVRNSGSSPVNIPELDAASVEFWAGRKDDTRRAQSLPVVSEMESAAGLGGRLTTLAPGASLSRKFVHTRLTSEAGEFVLQARYPAAGDGGSGEASYSESLDYNVAGTALFTRDADGLVVKADAVGIAERELGGMAGASDAILILDEKGFLKWWVNVRSPDEHAPKGALVDPYLGRFWALAEPFSPKAPPPNAKKTTPKPLQRQGE